MRRRLATALLAGSLGCTACVALPKRIDYPSAPVAEIGRTSSDAGRALALASTHALNNQAEMYSRRDRLGRRRDALRIAGFAGAIGTGAATAFDAGRNLTVALGLGTGTVLAASSLTVDRGYDLTYMSAAQALGCVARASRLAAAADGTAHDAAGQLRGHVATLAGLSGRLDPADRARAAAAQAHAEVAIARIAALETAGFALASRADAATDDIIDKARTQAAAQEPDRSAFAAALQSVGTLGIGAGAQVAAGLPPKSTSADAKDDKDRAPPPPARPSDPDARISLEGTVAAIEAARATLDGAIVAAGRDGKEALEKCGFAGVAVPTPIAVAGLKDNAAVVTKGRTTELRISGGGGDYVAGFIGPQPTAIQWSIFGDAITLTGRDELKAGESYTLRVRDLAAKGQSQDVNVVTK